MQFCAAMKKKSRKRLAEVPKIVKELGERIRSIRTEKNMSIEEVAFKAEIDSQNLRKYELGKQEMKISMLQRISNALGTPLSEILKDIE